MKKSIKFLGLMTIFFLGINSYAQDIEPRGGLRIYVGPAPEETAKAVAELLITDPAGRQAGLDISRGTVFQGIPNASYGKERIDNLETGEPGHEVGLFESIAPVDGVYKVDVIGTGSGDYIFGATAYDINFEVSGYDVTGTAYPGKIDYYEITYSSSPGSQVKLKFVGSSEIPEVTSAIKIHPDRWNLNWYNWIKEHMGGKGWIKHFAERVSILCLIGNLKDNEGNPHSVKEIDPKTILLNEILPPQPWRFMSEEKIALILKSKEDRYLKKRKGFKEWHHRKGFLKDYKGPVMLVKFNKFKAMETIPEMTARKEYEVIVSGELNDGKRFKGTAKIEITEWKAKHKWKWEHPDWLNSDKDIDNWWNKEKDFERWWKKIRKKHRRETGGKGYKR